MPIKPKGTTDYKLLSDKLEVSVDLTSDGSEITISNDPDINDLR